VNSATLSPQREIALRSENDQPLPPVRKPATSFLKLARDVLNHGGPGYLQFAITNVCNAKCDFCGFAVDKFDPRKRRSVTLEQAQDAIDIALKNRIGYLLFVGGEPLVHRDLRAMVRYTALRGIHPMICTNGSLWTERNMSELADSGLSSVIMSVDAHDVASHEKKPGSAGCLSKNQTSERSLYRARNSNHGQRHCEQAY
jgi:MoaA/NifB/PqqE/SkfB family radical SAM enzyme